MALSFKGLRQSQPVLMPEVNWSNPITQKLVFAAVPVGYGPLFIDLVTRTFPDTITGTFTPVAIVNAGGKSTPPWAYAVQGGDNCALSWPADGTVRGGSQTTSMTLLCLGGTADQVDGNAYTVGGTSEIVTSGLQPILGIDSFLAVARGNVGKLKFDGSFRSFGTSANAALNNPFNNQLHFFGYSFQDSGDSGDYFYGNTTEAFSALGNTYFALTVSNSSRRARLFHAGTNGASTKENVIVAYFLMWDRRLNVEEYRSLYRNPWQLFTELQPRMYMNAAAAASGGPFPHYTRRKLTGGMPVGVM